MNHWLMAILFFWPAAVGNAAPVFANKIPILKNWRTPLDFGYHWHKQRILGENKTWRGVVTGTVCAGLTALLLAPVLNNNLSLFDSFALGLLMGFGALVGDAIESLIKRRRGVPAGQSWFPFDQTDYIIGALLFIWPFADLTLKTMGLIFVTFFVIHLIFTYIGYLTGLRDAPI